MHPSRSCRTCGVALIKKPGRGRWPYWCNDCRTPRPAEPCQQTQCSTGCGATIRPHSTTITPLCRRCRNAAKRRPPGSRTIPAAERSRRARRASAQRRLQRAARGTTGHAVWTQGPCNWCGTQFAAAATGPSRWCSETCNRRAKRQRRTTTQYGGTGWRWSDFMRMAGKFNYCCAYCGTKPDRLDPDHVVPLARGGDDSLTNLLPTCLPCNSDKRDLLLTEWHTDRTRRGLPPRLLDLDGPRFHHLALRTVTPRTPHAA